MESLQAFRQQNKGKLIWFHCASLGEFEQALPIIELIKAETDYLVACSFFSPSGFKYQKNNKNLDWVGYLPIDLKQPINKFIKAMAPTKVIIVKNEWWWNMLTTLKDLNVDTYFISSKITKDHYFVKYKREYFSNLLDSVDQFFVINSTSKEILSELVYSKISVAGDTKVDRVIQNSSVEFKDSIIESYSEPIIYASFWKEDFDKIGQTILENNHRNHIIFPHNIDQHTLSLLIERLGKVDLYSTFKKKTSNILLVDQIGILKYACRYGSRVYVGGGFGDGIHNILEPMVYNIPVSCGPKIKGVPEAIELKERNLLTIVHNNDDFKAFLNQEISKEVIQAYFDQNKGAVQYIYQEIIKL